MLLIKTSNHILTKRNTKSYRSGRTSTGISTSHLDTEILFREAKRLLQRNKRRGWLMYQWNTFPIYRRVPGILLKEIEK